MTLSSKRRLGSDVSTYRARFAQKRKIRTTMFVYVHLFVLSYSVLAVSNI